jgi:hypothetical protein
MSLPRWFSFKTKPYEHQALGFTRSRDADNFGLFWEVGTGKTKPLLDTAAYLHHLGEIDTLFVIANNGVHRQWVVDEVPAHLPDWCERRAMFYRAGRFSAADRAVLDHKDPHVLRIITMNTESLSHGSGLEFARTVMDGRKVMLGSDESHKFKTPGSKRTRNIWKLAAEAAVRRIATGTEITQGFEDLYAQMRILDWRIIGCKTATEYRHTYCVEVGQFRKIVGYKNTDELLAKIQPHIMVVEKKDCLDLPERTYVKREVELSPEQRRVYNDLRSNFIAELANGNIIDAPLAITRLMRLQQIIAGHVPQEGGGWSPLPCPRLAACVDIVEEARRKVIVWIRFRADAVQVGEALRTAGIAYVDYNGSVSAAQKAANLERFKSDPNVKVFLGTPAAGGTGLTINEANTVVFYSHSFSYEERVQAEARCHRIGQTHPVTYYDLVAPGTVDTKVLAALRRKGEVAALMRDPATFKTWLEDLSD